MSNLTKAGDQLQSCASRMAEWILDPDKRNISTSYEVQVAALEAQSAVDEWTAARTSQPEGEGPEAISKDVREQVG